jgi:hypothetical protein
VSRPLFVPRGSDTPRRLASTVRLPLWFGCHRCRGKERGTEALRQQRNSAARHAPRRSRDGPNPVVETLRLIQPAKVNYGVDALKFEFVLSRHRTPLVSLKAVYVFHGLDRKSESDFAGAVEKLKQMITNTTAKLALLAWSRRQFDATVPRSSLGTNDA